MEIPHLCSFRQVDVFTSPQGPGNPVAVVLGAKHLSEETMREFSVWSNLSEVTFVTAPTVPGADYSVRIFSLDQELPFAGHPTLGSVRAWLDAGGQPASPGMIVQHCPAGLISIKEEGDVLSFAAPPLLRSGPVDDAMASDIRGILGVEPHQVAGMRLIDNGPGWVGVLLSDPLDIAGLRPSLAAHPGTWAIGVAACTLSDDHQLVVRAFFSDLSGTYLREDPVTGSLNASLAQWLGVEGVLPPDYLARQGTGLVRIHTAGDDIWVGGRTRVVITGTISL